MPDEILIIIRHLEFHRDAARLGSGEFRFEAAIDGAALPGDATIHRGATRGPINLAPEASFSRTLDMRNRTASVVLRFRIVDAHGATAAAADTITFHMRVPAFQRSVHAVGRHFNVDFDVQIRQGGVFGAWPPDRIFACRARPGSALCTTVTGRDFGVRLELHPVRPTPTSGLPPRPRFVEHVRGVHNTAPTNLTPAAPANAVPNPAVIPILGVATDTTAARIETTFFAPASMAFVPGDPRLVWSVRPGPAGGGAAFFGPALGPNVMVNGTARGSVLLEVRFEGVLLCTYRALVEPLHQIPCRFNILNGPPGARPRSTPAHVVQHLAVANLLLRQVAIELVLDTDPATTDGAVATGTPGVFRITVAPGLTRNIDANALTLRGPRLNGRANVMNFAYVVSDNAGNFGATTDNPASTRAGHHVTDRGTPSASWQVPSGVPPDAAVRPRAMRYLGALGRTGFPAMYVTDENGPPGVASAIAMYAGTIAHEFGHVLNLAHRNEFAGLGFNDELFFPFTQNLMNGTGMPTRLAQDLDIAQAMVALASPLIPP